MKADEIYPEIPGFITTKQAGDILGVAGRTIIRWFWEDKIELYRLGSMVAVPLSEVQRLQEMLNENSY